MNKTLPTKTLLKALIISIVLAVIIYFVIILPTEYGKDPTGLGKQMGLLVLSNTNDSKSIKEQTTINEVVPIRKDVVLIAVPANRGIEYKFDIQKHGRLVYGWETLDESTIYFDFHGEPKGDTTGFFESYSISTANQSKGTATVPFSGSHGWYWKNTSNKEVNIELTTSGNYTVLGLK